MRHLLWIVALFGLSLPAIEAHADDRSNDRANDRAEAKKLSQEGVALARQNNYEQAIEKFKGADALAPTAANDCNIALSYLRLERFPQAELFTQRCKRRWVREKTTPLPSWVGKGHDEVTKKLAKGDYGQLDLTTTPKRARLTIRAFGADESIDTPATLWLARGDHSLTVVSEGYDAVEKTVTISGTAVVRLSVSLSETKTLSAEIDPPTDLLNDPSDTTNGNDETKGAAVKLAGSEPVGPSATVLPKGLADPGGDPVGGESRTLAWASLGTGGALLVGGVVVHALALGAKSDAEALEVGPTFDDKEASFRTLRTATIGLYAVGAVATGVGAYLLLRGRDSEGGARIDASIGPRGAAIGLGWTFQ